MHPSVADDMGSPAAACSGFPTVILAGGRATRMGGGDKPLLPFAGATVLDHVLARLVAQAGPIAINANGDPARFAAWSLPVLADPLPGQPGPLAGVLAAMLWATRLGAARVLTVPGDAPFLPVGLVARLAEATDGIAIAASGGRAHPVVGLWPVRLAPVLAASLAAGERRVDAWAARQGRAVVAFPYQDVDPFTNLNTADDLAGAERHARPSEQPRPTRHVGFDMDRETHRG